MTQKYIGYIEKVTDQFLCVCGIMREKERRGEKREHGRGTGKREERIIKQHLMVQSKNEQLNLVVYVHSHEKCQK